MAEIPTQYALIAGAAMLYIAGRAAAEALAGGRPAPGWRAIGHWLPVAAVAIGAVWRGENELALAILLASSVAALSLVGGCVAIMGAAPNEPEIWPDKARRACGLLLPATILVYLCGFSGILNRFNVELLGAEGLVLLFVWTERGGDEPGRSRGGLLPGMLVALILCVCGGWVTVDGASHVNSYMDNPSSTVAAATILAPILVASMLLSGSALAQRGQAWAAHASCVGLAQLNLCVGLPMAAVLWHFRWHSKFPFPLHSWRVDAIVLVLLGAALLPAALGRWRPRKLEGLLHVGLYVGYVLAVAAVTLR